MSVPVAQARLIAISLQRYEQLKPAYVQLKLGSQSKDVALGQQRIALTAKDSIIASYGRSNTLQSALLLDARLKGAAWQTKARRRGWTVAALLTGLAGFTFLSVR